jgi:hypothetical protein
VIQFGVNFATLCALLEKRGYHKQDIGQLTRVYVQQVLHHATDDKGNIDLRIHESRPKPVSHAEGLRRLLWQRGWPKHKFEERIRQVAAEKVQERERKEQAKEDAKKAAAAALAGMKRQMEIRRKQAKKGK